MPTLLISTDGKDWKPALKVEKGHQFSLQYKVVLDGESQVRVELPVYNPNDIQSISKEQALMDADDWSAAMFPQNPDATIEKGKLGVCEVRVNGAPEEIVFQVQRDGAPSFQDEVKRATCQLRTKDSNTGKWKPAPDSSVDVTLSADNTPPSIVYFRAERQVLPSGGETYLSWSVTDANKVTIRNQEKKKKVASQMDKYGTGTLSTDSLLSLEAENDAEEDAYQSLTIKVFNGTDIAIHASAFKEEHEAKMPGRKLMNLYAYGEKIYALVLEEASEDVFMWESFDGFNWHKSYFNSRYISFSNADNQAAVPLAFAGSPSVVWNDKVYLIGGSRYDADIRSNEVYFYDYAELEKGWQKLPPATQMFTPRMGHACVVHGNQIRLLGGCTDTGAQSDIWTFDGVKWQLATTLKLPERRAMHSAIVYKDHIQIFGGVDYLPGDASKNITDAYELQGNNAWTKIPWNKDIDKAMYVACEVAIVQDERFIFSVVWENANYFYRCDQVVGDTLHRIKSDGTWLFPDALQYTQAVHFKDVLWLCSVTQNEGIQSQELHYLVYVKS